jgi:hypothetical protein
VTIGERRTLEGMRPPGSCRERSTLGARIHPVPFAGSSEDLITPSGYPFSSRPVGPTCSGTTHHRARRAT